ncbi:hypothetical protein KAJ89_02005 [Candidatus Parcubacteria bacterium]|nr:hypothetical protein [Candidatus Parcubacteria bacterium]
MPRKKPKNKIKKRGLILLILVGVFYFFKNLLKLGKSTEKIKQGIKEYAKEEKREIEELVTNKQGLTKFLHDSKCLLKDYFIPHNGNGHKPKFLHPKTLITIALLVLLIKAVTLGSLFLSYPQGARVSSVIVNRVLELVNIDRTNSGLGNLAMNNTLSASALAKANDLVAYDYFAHTSLDGKRPWDWIDRGQYQYLFVGENLAMNFTTAESVHRALMDSPTHKANILNERYIDAGIAMVSGMINGKQTNVLVQHFAVRSNPQLVLAAVEEAKAEPIPAPVTEIIEEPAVVKGEEAPLPPSIAEVPLASELIPAVNLTSQNQAGSQEENIVPELVSDLDQINLAVANISPNEALEKDLVTQVLSVANPVDEKLVLTQKRLKYINYIFLSILSLVILALVINIIIRVEIQHKHVIAQTLVLILFISSMVFFKFHFLESGVVNILLL